MEWEKLFPSTPAPSTGSGFRVPAARRSDEPIRLGISREAQIIDDVLNNPVLAAELRGRGVIARPQNRMRGHIWTARRDGTCMKAIGWELNAHGHLVDKLCGGMIYAGSVCWRQDGWKFYGFGCHLDKFIRLPMKFVTTYITESNQYVQRPEQVQPAIDLAMRIWNTEFAAGNLAGEYGSEQYNHSCQLIFARILEQLQKAKEEGWNLLNVMQSIVPPSPEKRVHKKRTPSKKADFTKLNDTGLSRVGRKLPDLDMPRGKRTLGAASGVIKSFDEQDHAIQYTSHLNQLRKDNGLRPLYIEHNDGQYQVINPDIIDARSKS